jgi:hypothetical protein
MKPLATFFVLAALLLSLGCSRQSNVSYEDDVKKALEQSDLKDVTVSEDKNKNTITLGGTLHSDQPKLQTWLRLLQTPGSSRTRLASSLWVPSQRPRA